MDSALSDVQVKKSALLQFLIKENQTQTATFN